MRYSLRVALVIISALLAALSLFQPSIAQIGESRYFPETNKTVSGDFLRKYESVPNPILVYGYPITDEFIAPEGSPVSGLRVQYFTRARFEYNPDPTAEERVIVAPLGTLLYEYEKQGFTPNMEAAVPASPACRFFEQTGQRTCYSFLSFYEANGDLKQFGLPVSPILKINGRLVQYFEYARFEWHPELPAGRRVILTNIGKLYYDLVEKPYQPGAPSPAIPRGPVTSLKVRSFVQSAVVTRNSTQTIYVVVSDQDQNPLQGAQVTLTLLPADGKSKLLVLNVTDAKGLTSVSLVTKDLPIGIVEVKVTVNYGSALQKQTVTSFRVWY